MKEWGEKAFKGETGWIVLGDWSDGTIRFLTSSGGDGPRAQAFLSPSESRRLAEFILSVTEVQP